MGFFNPIDEANRIQQQITSLRCPRCTQELSVDGIYSGDAEEQGFRKIEGNYFCSCGYSVVITERYPAISSENPHQPFARHEAI